MFKKQEFKKENEKRRRLNDHLIMNRRAKEFLVPVILVLNTIDSLYPYNKIKETSLKIM